MTADRPTTEPRPKREALLHRLQACARKYPDFPEASIWLDDIDALAAEAAQGAAPRTCCEHEDELSPHCWACHPEGAAPRAEGLDAQIDVALAVYEQGAFGAYITGDATRDDLLAAFQRAGAAPRAEGHEAAHYWAGSRGVANGGNVAALRAEGLQAAPLTERQRVMLQAFLRGDVGLHAAEDEIIVAVEVALGLTPEPGDGE